MSVQLNTIYPAPIPEGPPPAQVVIHFERRSPEKKYTMAVANNIASKRQLDHVVISRRFKKANGNGYELARYMDKTWLEKKYADGCARKGLPPDDYYIKVLTTNDKRMLIVTAVRKNSFLVAVTGISNMPASAGPQAPPETIFVDAKTRNPNKQNKLPTVSRQITQYKLDRKKVMLRMKKAGRNEGLIAWYLDKSRLEAKYKDALAIRNLSPLQHRLKVMATPGKDGMYVVIVRKKAENVVVQPVQNEAPPLRAEHDQASGDSGVTPD